VSGLITTVIEIFGAILITVGIGMILGVGAALIAGGVLILTGSFLATRAEVLAQRAGVVE
jgi:hypothetical protein